MAPVVLAGPSLIKSQCVTTASDRRSTCTHRRNVNVSKGMTAYSLANFRPEFTSAWFSWERKNSWRNMSHVGKLSKIIVQSIQIHVAEEQVGRWYHLAPGMEPGTFRLGQWITSGRCDIQSVSFKSLHYIQSFLRLIIFLSLFLSFVSYTVLVCINPKHQEVIFE